MHSNAVKVVRALIMTLACLQAPPPIAIAQEIAPLPLEDALSVHSFGFSVSSTDISPDGKSVAYTVQNGRSTKAVDRETWFRTGVRSTGDSIYISHMQTRETRNLTGETSESWLPAWSPDGRYLAFLSDRDGSGQAKLWAWETANDELRRISNVAVRTDEIEWLPDGRSIILTALPEGLSAEDYAEKLASATEGQKPDVSKTQGSTVMLYQSSAIGQTDKESSRSDPWSLGYTLRDLVLVDVASGKTSTVVHDKRIAKFVVSSDGSRVAYTIPKRFEKAGSQQILFDLAVVTIQTRQERITASDIPLDYDGGGLSWSPDSALISYHTGGPGNLLRDCYVVKAIAGGPRNITKLSPLTQPSEHKSSVPLWDRTGTIYFIEDGALWRASVDKDVAVKVAQIPGREIRAVIPRSEGVLWTSENDKSTVVVTHDDIGKQSGFYEIDLDSGRSYALVEKGQCYTCAYSPRQFVVARDGRRMLYFAEDAQHDADLWYGDAKFKNPQRITHLNPLFDKYKMGRARLIDWLSDDGQSLRGVLLLPSGYQEGRRYPLVLWAYGGISFSNVFNRFGIVGTGPFNMQLLATRGYAVLLPDSPQQVGTAMADLVKTMLPGVNKVIEMGIADADRLGVMGQSNGGYSTLALIVQTKRFKAAIEMDGPGDLIGFYSEMNKAGTTYGVPIEHAIDPMGGSPWQVRERYIENSPFFYLERIETPLLMVHGGGDEVVAAFLGDQVFVGLRRLGKQVEYAKYEGEGHSALNWSYANQLDLWNRIVAWLEKHLRASGH